MGVNLVAVLFGFAEATLFFIVPDVYLSAVGLRDLKKAMYACVYALVGALIGGVIMYQWGARHLDGVLEVLDQIPAISSDMLAGVHADIGEKGVWSVLLGPLLGTPYKVYAAQASSAGVGLVPFLLVSIPARLVRFVLVTAAARLAADRIARTWSFPRRLVVLGVGWTIFYMFYFLRMPN